MTGPRRLKDEYGIEAMLLRSAEDDRAPASLRQALPVALGLAPPAPPAPAPAPQASGIAPVAAKATVSVGTGVKAVAAIAIIAGLGLGIAKLVRAPEPARAPAPVAITAPPPVDPVPPVIAPPTITTPTVDPVAPIETPAPPVAAVVAPRTHRSALPPPTAEPALAATAQTPPSATKRPPSLSPEIALIDRARAAVRRHDAAAALAVLDDYDQQFPSGAMATEAAVARIEATLAAGDRDRARELADAFLAAHADNPLARRVRALIAAAADAAP